MVATDPIENIRIVLSLFYLVWIYAWAKKNLGSAKIGVLFAVIVVYLTFFQFPELVWVPVIFFLLAFFFSGMFEKIGKQEGKGDFYEY